MTPMTAYDPTDADRAAAKARFARFDEAGRLHYMIGYTGTSLDELAGYLAAGERDRAADLVRVLRAMFAEVRSPGADLAPLCGEATA
jgi:hypothetical protein